MRARWLPGGSHHDDTRISIPLCSSLRRLLRWALVGGRVHLGRRAVLRLLLVVHGRTLLGDVLLRHRLVGSRLLVRWLLVAGRLLGLRLHVGHMAGLLGGARLVLVLLGDGGCVGSVGAVGGRSAGEGRGGGGARGASGGRTVFVDRETDEDESDDEEDAGMILVLRDETAK